MLFEQHVPFRPDWEHVISPWSDFLEELARRGGRWAAAGPVRHQPGRLLDPAGARIRAPHRRCRRHDPGIDDVAASWRAQLTPEHADPARRWWQEKFDAFMAIGMQSATPRERQASCNGARQAIRNPRFRLRALQGGRAILPARRTLVERIPHADHDHRPRRRTVPGPASHGASTTLCPAPRSLVHDFAGRGARTCTASRWPAPSSNSGMFDLAERDPRHPWLTLPPADRSSQFHLLEIGALLGVAVEAATGDSRTRVVLWSMTLANAMILVDHDERCRAGALRTSCRTSMSEPSRCNG